MYRLKCSINTATNRQTLSELSHSLNILLLDIENKTMWLSQAQEGIQQNK